MFGRDGVLGRGMLAGIGGRVILGTEGNVGKEGKGVLAVGSVGNDATLGNVTAVGKFGIVGNFCTVG
uniref:Uncharacterized protein n=1 Tax=Solanum lycopersicum TaxID=4081 RepID=A0A3Q7EGX2_SOLLC